MATVTSNLLDELRAALYRRPFAPFAIVTHDGKRHRVTRQFQAGTNGHDVAIISKNDVMTWFKMHDVIAIQPITPRRRGMGHGKS